VAKLPKIGSDLSLSERAYRVIKDSILNNRLKPREILSEEMLAKQLGISRTPVREALKKLAFERLVMLNPGKNAVVADISEEDMRNVFTIRVALEPVAARLAAENITGKQINKLEEMLRGQEEALESEDYELYLQKDYEFHTSMARYTNNEQLYDIIVSISTQVQRFLILSQTLQKSSPDALKEHKEVLMAIKNRNPAEAEEMMRRHVNNVTTRILG
jgi:DNA-binding GntR family transcriptional regulator